VIRALLDIRNHVMKSQCRGSIILLKAPGLQEPHVSEREVYVQLIYLTIYPSIASKEKQGGNRHMKKSGKKRRFVTRDNLLDYGEVAKIGEIS